MVTVPSADTSLLLSPSYQYHPDAANALGAGGGSSSKDLYNLQLRSAKTGVNVPGAPPLNVPGLSPDFTSNLPPLKSNIPEMGNPQIPNPNADIPPMKIPTAQTPALNSPDIKIPPLTAPPVPPVPAIPPVNFPGAKVPNLSRESLSCISGILCSTSQY